MNIRLPETVTQAGPDQAICTCGSAPSRISNMPTCSARSRRLDANVVSRFSDAPRFISVTMGPFTTVQQADVVLEQVMRAGVTDARIVVE